MTPIQMLMEKERRQAEHIATLGRRPPWWRPFARSKWDRRKLFIMQMHTSDLDHALRAPIEQRDILADLLGWRR